MSRLTAFLLSALCGPLFAAAYPPVGQWWLAWFWLLPLLAVLWSGEQRKGVRLAWFGFRHGWLAGFSAFVATLWWVGHVTVPGMFALCVYLGLFPAVWGAFAVVLRPATPGRGILSALALGGIWAGLEWLRSWLLTGFPWNAAAVPLVEMPGLRALAAYTGVTGLSAVPVFFMAGIAAAWSLRRHRSAKGKAVLLAVTLATPAVLTLVLWEQSPQPAGSLRVLLVQPNLSMAMKMHLDLADKPEEERFEIMRQREEQRYADLLNLTGDAYQAAKEKPALIVWPESAIPGRFHDDGHDTPLNSILALGPVTLITGADAIRADPTGTYWLPGNCIAMMRGKKENFLLHGKIHLVPFGEYIPLRKQLPFLEKMLGDLIPNDFSPGDSTAPLVMDGLPCEVIPLVCFEDTIADLARQFVRDAPQLMVNVTNDNWFAESNESAIHALNARWRCIELNRPMVRSANTGVTCVIDTEGRITHEIPRWKAGVLHASVPYPKGGITFYARNGELFSMLAGCAGLAILFLNLLKPHRP